MEKKSKMNILAGVLLIVASLYSAFLDFIYAVTTTMYDYGFEIIDIMELFSEEFLANIIDPYGLLFSIALILLAVACFTRKKGVLTIIAAVLLVINSIYEYVCWGAWGVFTYASYFSADESLAYLSYFDLLVCVVGYVFLILGIVYYSFKNRKNNKAINVLFIIGTFVAPLDYINPIVRIMIFLNGDGNIWYSIYGLFCMLGYALMAVTLFFLAQWMIKSETKQPVQPQPVYQQPVYRPVQPVYQQPIRPVYQQPVYRPVQQPVPQQNTAADQKQTVENLKMYKELLDTGVITQEEYDAKKKEILGL